jgi:hypothetical protein
MSGTGVLVALVAVALIVGGLLFFRRKRAHTVNTVDFNDRWQALQKQCAARKTWPLAIIDADNLLDEALKRRNFKGKTTGERLVAAQHTLTSNDMAWFGHKLRNRIVHEDVRKLKKQDVLDALGGFRQALKDLGAL